MGIFRKKTTHDSEQAAAYAEVLATRAISKRLKLLSTCFVVLYLALATRLVNVQVFAREDIEGVAIRQSTRVVSVPRARGEIRDRTGIPLAFTERGYALWVDSHRIEHPRELADEIALITNQESNKIMARLTGKSRHVCLSHTLTNEMADKVRTLEIKGSSLKETWLRHYTTGRLSAALIGTTGRDGKGLEGIEYTWNSALEAIDGKRKILRTGRGGHLEMSRGGALGGVDGANVELTIDAHLQSVASTELERMGEYLNANNGSCVLMDAENGEIIAMASWPSYEPNKRGSATAAQIRNRAIQDAREPGSVFKPFAVAWALELGLLTEDEKIDCENGKWKYVGGRIIHDTHPAGKLTPKDILIRSSNIGAGKIGVRLGYGGLESLNEAFGFGKKTRSGLAGEAAGVIGSRTAWTPHTLVSMPFGQEQAVTPLQLASGYATLVNGGLKLRPSIIRRVVDSSGITLMAAPSKERIRVISAETSHYIRSALKGVVEDSHGTATRVRTRGLSMGGKTGTAQKYERDPKTGKLTPSKTKTTAVFCGAAPIENPKYVCVVMWDEPKTFTSGGAAAAPVVAKILKHALSSYER